MITTFTHEPLSPEVRRAVERAAALPGVVQVAVMPDVHLAGRFCVGVALASTDRLYPDAIGNDVGCGVAAVPLNGPADLDPADLLEEWARRVPIQAHPKPVHTEALPPTPALPSRVLHSAARQFGTVGRGNHFLELHRDEAGDAWVVVHSGSRCLGPAVQERARQLFPNGSPIDQTYLGELSACRAWARASRRHMLEQAADAVTRRTGLQPDWRSAVDTDHNHVVFGSLNGQAVWIHRKGAIAAESGRPALIPGSMATPTYHVVGRAHGPALGSASHGAGRCLPRGRARRAISIKQVVRETAAVHIDPRKLDRLRDEAPSAYKPITAVMRAQKALVKVVRRSWPVVVHKGG